MKSMKTVCLFTALALMIMSVTSRDVYDALMAKRRDAFVKALMAEQYDEEPVPHDKIYAQVTAECLGCYPGCIESEAAKNAGAFKELLCAETCDCPDNYRP